MGTFDDWEFSFMPPSVAWAFSIIKVFSMSLHLLPVWGVILAKVISKKYYQAKKKDYKGYILALWKDYQRWPFFISNACI